jgi:hypothetical protein
MRIRDRTLVCAIAAVAVVLAVVHLATGVGADALMVAPALLLLLPLVAGRYVGSERLVRVVRRVRPPARRRGAIPVARRRRDTRPTPRGGLLIAVSLARRGPPASAAAR